MDSPDISGKPGRDEESLTLVDREIPDNEVMSEDKTFWIKVMKALKTKLFWIKAMAPLKTKFFWIKVIYLLMAVQPHGLSEMS